MLVGRPVGGKTLGTVTIPHWGAARVVGVVGHVEHYGLDGSAGEKPQIYYSLYQLPDAWFPTFREDVTFVVRSRITAATVIPAIRNAVYQDGSGQPVYNIRTMQELASASMGRQRFPMLILAMFASLALLLAFVGTYGMISYSISRRTREIGIRVALGAKGIDVLRMLIGEGFKLAVAGTAVGLMAALASAWLLSSFSRLLFRVPTTDPVTLIEVSFVLITAALLASYVPARRAARLDPLVVLRHE
jgi:putative ABC transport system permease protein